METGFSIYYGLRAHTIDEDQFLIAGSNSFEMKKVAAYKVSPEDTTTKGSLALSFETVFNKARNANIWLSPSYYSSLEALEKANQHYIEFEAFQNKSIYSFSNTIGETGGVLYYELGTARPDIVLKDW